MEPEDEEKLLRQCIQGKSSEKEALVDERGGLRRFPEFVGHGSCKGKLIKLI